MRYNVCDTRTLAAAIVLPASDKFFNTSTGGFETPFDPSKHLTKFAPVEAAPSIFSGVQSVDLGEVLQLRPDAALVVLTIGTDGTPVGPIDVLALPVVADAPTIGGWTR